MCGIFGFALTEPLPLNKILTLLEKLEVHQYPQEPKPVGGYGAGVAIVKSEKEIILEKVGSIHGSPAKRLSEIVKTEKALVLMGHVRMPSPQFMATAKFGETAQPYIARCYPDSSVVSVHNGSVTNYKEIREKLGKAHIFESEKVELIDSEVIPHLFEEAFETEGRAEKALDVVYSVLEGPNAISLMQVGKQGAFLHFIHKGKTRGLNVWTNKRGEIIFCTREEPVMEQLGSRLATGKFRKRISIPYRSEKDLKASFSFEKMTLSVKKQK